MKYCTWTTSFVSIVTVFTALGPLAKGGIRGSALLPCEGHPRLSFRSQSAREVVVTDLAEDWCQWRQAARDDLEEATSEKTIVVVRVVQLCERLVSRGKGSPIPYLTRIAHSLPCFHHLL